MKSQYVYRTKRRVVAQTGVDYKSSYRMIRFYAQVILNYIPQSLALV